MIIKLLYILFGFVSPWAKISGAHRTLLNECKCAVFQAVVLGIFFVNVSTQYALGVDIFNIFYKEGIANLHRCVEKYPGHNHLRVSLEKALLVIHSDMLEHISSNYTIYLTVKKFLVCYLGNIAKMYIPCLASYELSLAGETNLRLDWVPGKWLKAESHVFSIQFLRIVRFSDICGKCATIYWSYKLWRYSFNLFSNIKIYWIPKTSIIFLSIQMGEIDNQKTKMRKNGDDVMRFEWEYLIWSRLCRQIKWIC